MSLEPITVHTYEPSWDLPPNVIPQCNFNTGLLQPGIVQLQQQEQLQSLNEPMHINNNLQSIPQHEYGMNCTQQDSGIHMTTNTGGTSSFSRSEYIENRQAEITAQLERQLMQVQS